MGQDLDNLAVKYHIIISIKIKVLSTEKPIEIRALMDIEVTSNFIDRHIDHTIITGHGTLSLIRLLNEETLRVYGITILHTTSTGFYGAMHSSNNAFIIVDLGTYTTVLGMP